jgi:hypothetical protein
MSYINSVKDVEGIFKKSVSRKSLPARCYALNVSIILKKGGTFEQKPQ